MLDWLTGGQGAQTEKLLDPAGIGVLSASCCSPHAFRLDEELIKNLKEAQAAEGIAAPISYETITHAQAGIGRLMGRLSPAQLGTVQQVMAVFSGKGVGGFPVLIVGGKIATSGTVPTVAALRELLRGSSLPRSAPHSST